MKILYNILCVKSIIKTFADIVLPNLCFVCEAKIKTGHLCEKCVEKIEFISPPLSKLPSQPGERLPYEKLICITSYKEPMVNLIHLFKYQNYSYLSGTFASLMIKHLQKTGFVLSGYDIIAPVPMHKAKLRERGYNQSELLARIIAKHFNISFKNDIIIVKSIRPSQAKLNSRERKENLKNLFEARGNLEGKNIILIDDIFTTGQTAKECAYALKAKGARVSVLTLSKTQ